MYLSLGNFNKDFGWIISEPKISMVSKLYIIFSSKAIFSQARKNILFKLANFKVKMPSNFK